MRNIVFLNLINSNSYSQNPLPGNRTISEMVQLYTSRLEDVEKIIPVASDNEQIKSFYADENHPEALILEENRQDLLLSAMSSLSEGYDHCFYFFGDTPLLDNSLTERMYRNHLKYYADYSFADGYPLGLAAEIIKSGTIQDLKRIIGEKKEKIDRESIFSWIQKDINSFDIETEISSHDLRLKRISLSGDNKINFLQLNNFMKAGFLTADNFMERHDELEEHTRTVPNYYQLQIASSCPQSCSYCPYPGMVPDHRSNPHEMSADQIISLLNQVEEFTPDAVVSLSLWGEPSRHSEIEQILTTILDRTKLNFIVETSGIGWGNVLQNEELLQSDRIEWIISLDSIDPELYKKLRGEGMTEALSMIEILLKKNPDHTWIQAVRMKENENDLENFYRYWKEKTDNVIIQKYDHFSGKLPEKKITDLSPLNRFPCWHLKREMTILADGTVILCREVLDRNKTLGNCFNESIQQIWTRADSVFSEHRKGEYKGVCSNCDEYYSYNF